MLYIFDWDGTIMDSASKIIHCMQGAAQEVGLEVLANDVVKNIIGLGLPEAILRLYPEIEVSKLEDLRHHYVQHFIRQDQQPCKFFPGVSHTLEQLANDGHTLAVATGKSRRGLERVWDNLDMKELFHSSRCADETASKPDPQMLQELLQEFDLAAHEAVMIGDTEYDMEMAYTIGMPRIAVSYGAHHIDRLRRFDPVLCVDSFADVLKW